MTLVREQEAILGGRGAKQACVHYDTRFPGIVSQGKNWHRVRLHVDAVRIDWTAPRLSGAAHRSKVERGTNQP